MEEYAEPMARRERRFLIVALTILILLFMTLFYYYLTLVKPTEPLVKGKPAGLTFQFQIFGASKDDLFNSPSDVAVDKKGNIYVTDTLNNRVMVFDKRGKFLYKFPTLVIRPLGIAVAPNGDIAVASKRLDKVLIYTAKGKPKKLLNAFIPLDVAFHEKKTLVTTIGPIVVFNSKGKREFIGSHGREKENFAWPNGIAVGKDGTIYIADTNNLRLKATTPKGKVKWIVGRPPVKAFYTQSEGRSFGAPSGIALDEDDNVYLVDGFRDSIYVFSKNKKLLATLGGERGEAEGQFDHPSGIAYAGDGRIVVVDKFNSRVQVFKVYRPWVKKSVAARMETYWYFVLPLILLLLALLFFFLRRRRRQEETVSESSWA